MSHAEKFALSPSTTVLAESVEACPELDRSDHTALRSCLSKCAVHEQRPVGTQRGYALLLMLVLVTMGILFTVVSQVSLVGIKWGREYRTHVALLQAKEALIGYAATYRDTHPNTNGNLIQVFGYLPCPDIDGDGSGDALSADCGGTDGKAVIGLLPYKQLGLDNNQDADGNCLWYAVSGAYKASANPGTHNLPAPMNWDTQGLIEVRDAGDHPITTPNDANGGAAAVIFSIGPPVILSVGPPIGYQSRLAGTTTNPCGVSASTKANAAYANYIDVDPAGTDHAKSQPFPSAANNTVRVTQGTIGSSFNNDQILAITPKEIFTRAKQRSDHAGLLNTLMAEIGIALEGKIVSDLATRTDPNLSLPTSPTAITGANVGGIPALTVVNSNDTNLLNNWNNQYRAVVCNNLCGYCLNVGGQSCNGALLFGAESTTGEPRPSTTLLTDLFETDGSSPGDSLGALNIVKGITNSFAGFTTYNNGSNDVGICVAPSSRKPVTFSCNISSFVAQSVGPAVIASIDTAAAKVTLGNTTAIYSGSSSGCVWYPTKLPFHTALRAYFNFTINNPGEGFVFALADAARNAAGPVCGNSGASRLGYEGNTYPKFGLEIDTRPTTATNDFLLANPGNHYAFLYWGTTAMTADDNTHGAGTLGSHMQPLNPISSLSTSCVQSATWVSNNATIVTTTPHGLTSGQPIYITGIVPSAFNPASSGSPSTVIATVIDTTHFTYPLASDPGAYSTGGSVSAANIGLSSLTTCDTSLPYNSWISIPGPIYVRVDIAKNYTAPTGTYTLKAYVASTFPTCSLADFQNISSNLSDSCPALIPSIEQDGIAIDDISGSGEAMADVFAGFTSAQKDTVASNESVVITNFVIRSQ